VLIERSNTVKHWCVTCVQSNGVSNNEYQYEFLWETVCKIIQGISYFVLPFFTTVSAVL